MVLAKGLTPLYVVSIIFVVRILSVFLVQTWYVPDEYWQSVEIAHKQVFGYGAETWEWQNGLRSYLYPSIIAVFYTILKYTGLDYPEALIIVPRILQAILSTTADYYFYKWTGNRKWALFLILTSWFWFYTSGRTLLQTTETAIVTIALSVYPFKRYSYTESLTWIWLAVICMFIRPTSFPLWIVLGVYNLVWTNQNWLRLITRTYIPISLICGGVLIGLDSYFYGRLIVTPWEFFKFNVLHDTASFYGQHPWYWYFATGLPAVLGTHLILAAWAVYGILQQPKQNQVGLVLCTAAISFISVYSFIPHKEFRFILPLIPIFTYLAQDVVVPWSRKAKPWQLYLLAAVIVCGNVVPAAYFGLRHQAGTVRVMPLLRDALPSNRSSIAFLMPCHSTPLYSHLHVNVTTRYLKCDPPLRESGSVDEAAAFFNNPLRWWRSEYASRQQPTLLVLFDKLKGRLETVLGGYQLLHEIPHTQFPEGEVGENVLVYRRVKTQTPTADNAL